MIATLLLPRALRAQIEGEARDARPRECCGLIEGTRDGDTVHALALLAARNLSAEASRFEIDPADHVRALRGARERGHQIVGCYHSHPAGPPEPSAADRAGAGEEDFVWLIASLVKDSPPHLGAFVYAKGGFHALALAAPEP